MPNITECSIVKTENDSAVGIKIQYKKKSRQTGILLNKSTIIKSHGMQKIKLCVMGQPTSIYQYQG